MLRKQLLRATHASVRLYGDSAQGRENGAAAALAQNEPEEIADQRRKNGYRQRLRKTHRASRCQRPGGDQHQAGRNRQAYLFGEHSNEQNGVPVSGEKTNQLAHHPDLLPDGYFQPPPSAWYRLTTERSSASQ